MHATGEQSGRSSSAGLIAGILCGILAVTLIGSLLWRQELQPIRAVGQSNEDDEVIPPLLPPSGNFSYDLRSTDGDVRGVVLYLYGGNRTEAFMRYRVLPSLYNYFLSRHRYPLHIFHEGLPREEEAEMRRALPRVDLTLENVRTFWARLPYNITKRKMAQWRQEQAELYKYSLKRIQGTGYRIMCRFWFGLVWNLKSLNKYDYYWRMDSDSLLVGPVMEDPFKVMFQRRCEYGTRETVPEKGFIVGMYDNFLAWAAAHPTEVSFLKNSTAGELMPPPVAGPWSSREAVEAVKNFNPKRNMSCDVAVATFRDGKRVKACKRHAGMIMFYNNFEMGTFRLKRHPIYQSYFRWVDEQEPYGILRYRWGDAPLHTFAVLSMLGGMKRVCSMQGVPYKHPAD